MNYIYLFFITVVSGQGQWAERVYWNDNLCKEKYSLAIRVLIPQAPCQQSTPLNQICERKSLGQVKSGEGTGCSPVVKSEPIVPWLPSSSIGTPAGSKFLTITQYTSSTCDSTSSSIEMNSFVADGKCYAVETQESFFTAQCSENEGQLLVCKDSTCTNCDSLLNAGIFTQKSISFKSNQCMNSNGLGIKMTCTNVDSKIVQSAKLTATVDSNSSGGSTGSLPTNQKSGASTTHYLIAFCLAPFVLLLFT
ncbi:hypothetical protein BC833DRAFT_583744 [Globomyces pollinis-pini]|nr:hypothetical protein BC833DRAFT_583744 [Globomyces pollinis-pini]